MRLWKSIAIVAAFLVFAFWVLGKVSDDTPLPRLVANLTGDFYGDDPLFGQRVTSAYPAPVNLNDLVKDLADQGYVLDKRTAVFRERFLGCSDVWTISWQVAGEQAVQINGNFEHICP